MANIVQTAKLAVNAKVLVHRTRSAPSAPLKERPLEVANELLSRREYAASLTVSFPPF